MLGVPYCRELQVDKLSRLNVGCRRLVYGQLVSGDFSFVLRLHLERVQSHTPWLFFQGQCNGLVSLVQLHSIILSKGLERVGVDDVAPTIHRVIHPFHMYRECSFRRPFEAGVDDQFFAKNRRGYIWAVDITRGEGPGIC